MCMGAAMRPPCSCSTGATIISSLPVVAFDLVRFLFGFIFVLFLFGFLFLSLFPLSGVFYAYFSFSVGFGYGPSVGSGC